LFYSAIF